MKKIIISITFMLFAFISYSQNSLQLHISGVEKQGGTIYISLFNSERAYKEKAYYLSVKVDPIAETVIVPLKLPNGEYFFSVFQDSNNNGKLDSNLVGIPKELVGLSNYDGKSIPGNFHKHKVLVSELTKKVCVELHKI